ncbi:MAG: ParB N-terminal domain-containing protein [Planctomycetota bacterium]|nr:ParB N-terminal domain-containing protein [Planctomycetota bacterium]
MATRKKKPAQGSVGLAVAEIAGSAAPAEVKALCEQVAADGGVVLASYRDPFGGKWVTMAALPLEKVAPTPYQRELSETHAKRLEAVIPKVGRFLDPVIAVRAQDGQGYWTPNGMHRLDAMRRLGAKTIVALILPDMEVAYRILALNTEKAHNLKDKSLEVVRMARGLIEDSSVGSRPESDWAFEFEEPGYLTIGQCYEKNGRFSGSAYMPVVKRCLEFSSAPLAKSIKEHAKNAERLVELDEIVKDAVKKLQDAGLKSPYLKTFVIARINPLRWDKPAKPGQKASRADFGKTMDKMLESAKKFDASKVKMSDLSAMGGPPPSEE